HLIRYDREPFRDAVKQITDGRGADVVFDPVGGEVFENSMRCINWGGRILILGFLGGAPALARTNHLLIKGASAVGVRLGGFVEAEPEQAAENLRVLCDWAARGILKPYVSARLPLDRAADALNLLKNREAIGKVLLV
ncbi:MAG: zinc-binding dehydrogenase, partial [Alphaproteobacteria bacterium]